MASQQGLKRANSEELLLSAHSSKRQKEDIVIIDNEDLQISDEDDDEEKKIRRKKCCVPNCSNDSFKDKDKLFIMIPTTKAAIRAKWLEFAQINPKSVKRKSALFFCEDHFDIEKDMVNYRQYKMGWTKRNIMTRDCVPSRRLPPDSNLQIDKDNPPKTYITVADVVCIAPLCGNNAKKMPKKLFALVPFDSEKRMIWLCLANLSPDSVPSGQRIYLCSDHFDLQRDYGHLKSIGSVTELILADECYPSRFPVPTQIDYDDLIPPCTNDVNLYTLLSIKANSLTSSDLLSDGEDNDFEDEYIPMMNDETEDSNIFQQALDAEPTLDMEAWPEELSLTQLAALKGPKIMREAMKSVLDNVIKQYNARVLKDETYLTAFELGSYIHTQAATHAHVPVWNSQRGRGRPYGGATHKSGHIIGHCYCEKVRDVEFTQEVQVGKGLENDFDLAILPTQVEPSEIISVLPSLPPDNDLKIVEEEVIELVEEEIVEDEHMPTALDQTQADSRPAGNKSEKTRKQTFVATTGDCLPNEGIIAESAVESEKGHQIVLNSQTPAVQLQICKIRASKDKHTEVLQQSLSELTTNAEAERAPDTSPLEETPAVNAIPIMVLPRTYSRTQNKVPQTVPTNNQISLEPQTSTKSFSQGVSLKTTMDTLDPQPSPTQLHSTEILSSSNLPSTSDLKEEVIDIEEHSVQTVFQLDNDNQTPTVTEASREISVKRRKQSVSKRIWDSFSDDDGKRYEKVWSPQTSSFPIKYAPNCYPGVAPSITQNKVHQTVPTNNQIILDPEKSTTAKNYATKKTAPREEQAKNDLEARASPIHSLELFALLTSSTLPPTTPTSDLKEEDMDIEEHSVQTTFEIDDNNQTQQTVANPSGENSAKRRKQSFSARTGDCLSYGGAKRYQMVLNPQKSTTGKNFATKKTAPRQINLISRLYPSQLHSSESLSSPNLPSTSAIKEEVDIEEHSVQTPADTKSCENPTDKSSKKRRKQSLSERTRDYFPDDGILREGYPIVLNPIFQYVPSVGVTTVPTVTHQTHIKESQAESTNNPIISNAQTSPMQAQPSGTIDLTQSFPEAISDVKKYNEKQLVSMPIRGRPPAATPSTSEFKDLMLFDLLTSSSAKVPDNTTRVMVPLPNYPSEPPQLVPINQKGVEALLSSQLSANLELARLQTKPLSIFACASLRVPVESPTENRVNLNRKAKNILAFTPFQFTKYLLQEDLINFADHCPKHTKNEMKLGIYNDGAIYPKPSAHIWYSTCCPPRLVYHQSLFDGIHPPQVNFKLIYHWACQTNIHDVLKWVRIDNAYLQYYYTALRSICTVAVHSHFERLGGHGITVEVGIISMATTVRQDGTHRQKKANVLGILETKSRKIILQAFEPYHANSENYGNKERYLNVLIAWVDPASTVVIDIDENSYLNKFGFNNVTRSTDTLSNHAVMAYLRRVIPNMFHNALSMLSLNNIQHFLNELVWRETFGATSWEAFHNILEDIAEQTQVAGFSFERLLKVAGNPFRNWSEFSYLKAKRTMTMADTSNQITSLEPYYYGSVEGKEYKKGCALEVLCPLCTNTNDIVYRNYRIYRKNVNLMRHILQHITKDIFFCKYCLAKCSSIPMLSDHLKLKHPTETKDDKFFYCLICLNKFTTIALLGKHMSLFHAPSEFPYRCEICAYKSSSHEHVIDHFYNVHTSESFLQCPLCLMTADLLNGGSTIEDNLTNFMIHLRNHLKINKRQSSAIFMKCKRCVLQFLTAKELSAHTAEKHVSSRYEEGFMPFPIEGAFMVPKSLQDNEFIADAINNREYRVTFTIPENVYCKECNMLIASGSHFQKKVMYCKKKYCKYQTFCTLAMINHKESCLRDKNRIFPHNLEATMFCVCGFNTVNGNLLARHLVLCKRKSAYPSKDAATNACVPQQVKEDKDKEVQEELQEETSKHKQMEVQVAGMDAVSVEVQQDEVEKLDDKVEELDDEVEELEDQVEELEDNASENVQSEDEEVDDVEEFTSEEDEVQDPDYVPDSN